MKRFPEYTSLDLSEVGREMLADWQRTDLFRRSIALREGAPRFVFFEGPPSANGMPGIHHVMARTIKDTFCRYHTMRGEQVFRKAGWDTHGLPVELGVEKSLGITKEDIGRKISVEEYNHACRTDVMKFTREWTSLTLQMGYWVDLDHPYITYDNKYIETLWYLLRQLYDKGLLYKGYTIQPYSPAAGTGLSSHELNQPGCYRDVKDTTCTAQFAVSLPSDNAFLRSLSLDEGFERIAVLAWTTTPWTLPSNTALCVGPKIEYTAVESFNPYTGEPSVYILASARLSAYFKPESEVADAASLTFDAAAKSQPWRRLGTCLGADLLGIRYHQLFPWVRPVSLEDGKAIDRTADAFRVISGDYVTTDDGTGIVHIAPTFGADDAAVARAAGIPSLFMITRRGETRPMVDFTGKYWPTDELDADFLARFVSPDYAAHAGEWVKNAYDPQFTVDGKYDEAAASKAENLDIRLCMQMKADGRVFKIEKHTHNYPHCWRTDKPVLYYPLDSWFIRTTAVRDRLIALNRTILWKPESTGTGRFGKWLENLQDWNLSRSRYWGTPLPIWRTADGSEEKCIGSLAELIDEINKSVAAGLMPSNPYADFRVGDFSDENYAPERIDLHRPYVDRIVLVSSDGQPMHREPDLIDVWFDSGAMPYAQVHYPFEHTDAPLTADFISEGVDQTRGWFFTLHALHTMISDSVAYRSVISNGLVLDKNGNKMSKRLGNAVDPFSTIDRYGADPLRWYMLTNASPWDNLKFDPEGIEEVRRKFFGTLYNTYSFFALYANVDGFEPSMPQIPVPDRPEIDRWILSALHSLIAEVSAQYDAYEPTRAGRAIADFVGEQLSNWYVRLNRKRFWGGGLTPDKLAAYQTLHTCLRVVSLLMAPIAPFYADRLYRDLTGEESVHLADFPVADRSLVDTRLESCMRLAQQASSMILALRRKADLKVRQPLLKAVIPSSDAEVAAQLAYVSELIRTETNIKELHIVPSDSDELRLVKRVKPDFKVLGKKFGKQMKAIAAAISAFSQSDIADFERTGSARLALPDAEVVLELSDVEISTEDMPGWLVASEGSLTVALDIELSESLLREGVARELVNRVQNLRKQSGLEITDRIRLLVAQSPEVEGAVSDFHDYIASQVLAEELRLVAEVPAPVSTLDFDDFSLAVSLTKA